MSVSYTLSSELRERLKQPLGELIKGSFAETMGRLRMILGNERPPLIISVGDTVSRNLTLNQMHPQLAIVDNHCMRHVVQKPVRLAVDRIVHVKNPQATITEEAMTAIQEALRGNCSVMMVVEGEEDLLALAAIMNAPDNSLVVYGQPLEGIVVVRVTAEKKAEIARLLNSMRIARKAK